MKRPAIIRRVEAVNRSGTSKAGNPYTMDMTQVTIELPVDSHDNFGMKEVTYQYGDHTAIQEFEHLRGKLPQHAEIELDIRLNDYGREETFIKSVTLPKQPVKGA